MRAKQLTLFAIPHVIHVIDNGHLLLEAGDEDAFALAVSLSFPVIKNAMPRNSDDLLANGPISASKDSAIATRRRRLLRLLN